MIKLTHTQNALLEILNDTYQECGPDLEASFDAEGYDVDVIVDLAYDHEYFGIFWDDLSDEEKQLIKKSFRF